MAVEITEEFVWQSIPPRARESHKGSFAQRAGGGGHGAECFARQILR